MTADNKSKVLFMRHAHSCANQLKDMHIDHEDQQFKTERERHKGFKKKMLNKEHDLFEEFEEFEDFVLNDKTDSTIKKIMKLIFDGYYHTLIENPNLSNIGYKQTQHFKNENKNNDLESTNKNLIIFCSPLVRAMETAFFSYPNRKFSYEFYNFNGKTDIYKLNFSNEFIYILPFIKETGITKDNQLPDIDKTQTKFVKYLLEIENLTQNTNADTSILKTNPFENAENTENQNQNNAGYMDISVTKPQNQGYMDVSGTFKNTYSLNGDSNNNLNGGKHIATKNAEEKKYKNEYFEKKTNIRTIYGKVPNYELLLKQFIDKLLEIQPINHTFLFVSHKNFIKSYIKNKFNKAQKTVYDKIKIKNKQNYNNEIPNTMIIELNGDNNPEVIYEPNKPDSYYADINFVIDELDAKLKKLTNTNSKKLKKTNSTQLEDKINQLKAEIIKLRATPQDTLNNLKNHTYRFHKLNFDNYKNKDGTDMYLNTKKDLCIREKQKKQIIFIDI